MTPLVLIPHPHCLKQTEQSVMLPDTGSIILSEQSEALLPIACLLKENLQSFNNSSWDVGSNAGGSSFQVLLSLEPFGSKAEGKDSYQLLINPTQISISAPEAAGLFYAVMTLRQILRQCKTHLPECEIQDAPDFEVRGVLLDVSRDKVPKLSTLYKLIDQLAEWKINQLQLYTEHTFAYQNHPKVWENASPYTGADILAIQEYCKSRFIELVPNQNSFGHMERWLKHPEYKHLAECPDGFTWPWGVFNPEPFSLAPEHPGSFKLIEELYEELLPHFESPLFNVGCDETLDLGHGLSEALCEKQGRSKVYFDFVMRIYDEVKKHGRHMLFWADIVAEHPELLSQFPEDIIALEWGYESGHPFEERGHLFAEANIAFYVCPGTSSWCSIVGRTQNMLENLYDAAHQGQKHGACGYLITDWGDQGHWQYLSFSYPGLLAGSAFAWNTEAHRNDDFISALNFHVFFDKAEEMGALCHDLGNLYLDTTDIKNQTRLFQWIFKEAEHSAFKDISEKKAELLEDKLKGFLSRLSKHRMDIEDSAIVESEFQNAIRTLNYGIHRALAVQQNKIKDSKTQQQLNEMKQNICKHHRHLWLSRNREGGLQDSLQWIHKNSTLAE